MNTYLATTFSDYAAQLREFIEADVLTDGAGVDGGEEFNRLALELFALQFAHNAPYRKFCEGRKITPERVGDWREVPAMATAGFKELELTSLRVEERSRVFYSSGTTEQRPSRHFHSAHSLEIYEASLIPWFRAHLLEEADGGKAEFLALTPSPEGARNSSLVHMFETVFREFGTEDSIFTGAVREGVWELDWEKTLAGLRRAMEGNRPVVLLGTAFGFVHLLDALRERGMNLKLPRGSRVMETGGYKGRSRTMPKAELHALITTWLGVPVERIVCEYGMSELSSQAYDTVVRESAVSGRRFEFPHWARVQIISAETGRGVGEGETGLIRIFDLANVYSVMAVQTEDLGVRRGQGFELVGRAALAEARGCSLQSS